MREWLTTAAALRRTTAAIRRAEAARARTDTRAWMQNHRARTRRLIELGGLVQKSGLPEHLAALAAEDERAVILGALLMAKQMLAAPSAMSSAGDLIAKGARSAAALCATPINPRRRQPLDADPAYLVDHRRALWTTLALAFAGTAVLVGRSIALVLGALQAASPPSSVPASSASPPTTLTSAPASPTPSLCSA